MDGVDDGGVVFVILDVVLLLFWRGFGGDFVDLGYFLENESFNICGDVVSEASLIRN